MKQYPSINAVGNVQPPQPTYVFVKYDGSNIRCEWNKKRGWYKFGARRILLDSKDKILGTAISIFLDKYGIELEKIFKKSFKNTESVVAFAEFFGEHSFAGEHFNNDEKDVILFDINIHKKGLLGPEEFLNEVGHLPVAELILKGSLEPDFIQFVREEKIDITSKYKIKNETPEGVICKSGSKHQLWMCKIKTNRYLKELQKRLPGYWRNYWE